MRVRPVALALLLALPGCHVGEMVGRNARAFFRSPAKVANRIERPVRADARLAVLWIGHASALIQLDDKLVLTDPVFTETVAQVSRRVVEPGLDAKDLPRVDAAVISHLHPDHLSIGSLEMIEKKLGVLLMPQKGSVAVPRMAFDTIELPTWRSWERSGLRITSVPVRHSGFRAVVDGDWMDTSFTGWVFEYHGLTVYFGGDTAYDRGRFLATRERFPRIDLALLPIGPKNPRDLMANKHIDPGEALKAFADLGARWMVPVHHGTFIQSIDPLDAEARELAALAAAEGLADRVKILRIGEQAVLVGR